MKIVKLTAENVKRLKAVEITPDPDGNLVIISGRNDQGKTSVLDSIMYALAGKTKIPTKPIREGEKKAKITLDLGTIIVTRSWTANDKSYLKVENADGASFKNPQGLLDDLVGRLSFDPLAYAQMDGKARRQTLLELAKMDIDLAANDTSRKAMEENRRDHGRDLKQLEAQLAGMTAPGPDIPEEEIDTQEIIKELDVARNQQAVAISIHTKLELKARDLETTKQNIQDLQQRIVEHRNKLAAIESDMKELKESQDELPEVNTDALTAKLGESQAINASVRKAKEYRALQERIEEKAALRGAAQAAMDALDRKKAEALAGAQLPVPGLGLEDEEVTFEGIPWDQLSSSKQLRISLAMAMALNPKLRVIRITNGSLLDSESLKIIEEAVHEKDFQVWLETVDESGKMGVVIEDGAVKQ